MIEAIEGEISAGHNDIHEDKTEEPTVSKGFLFNTGRISIDT